MEQNPILIVDDDEDDLMLIEEASKELKLRRPIHFFRDGKQLISFLQSSSLSPFIIICDVNLPGETGFDIKKDISGNKELRYKSVPFIFWSTAATDHQIQHAYDLPAQGFFFKPTHFEDLCDTLRLILGYWQKSQHPKRVN